MPQSGMGRGWVVLPLLSLTRLTTFTPLSHRERGQGDEGNKKNPRLRRGF